MSDKSFDTSGVFPPAGHCTNNDKIKTSCQRFFPEDPTRYARLRSSRHNMLRDLRTRMRQETATTKSVSRNRNWNSFVSSGSPDMLNHVSVFSYYYYNIPPMKIKCDIYLFLRVIPCRYRFGSYISPPDFPFMPHTLLIGVCSLTFVKHKTRAVGCPSFPSRSGASYPTCMNARCLESERRLPKFE